MRAPFFLILLLVLLFSSGFIADTLIDYQWWKELGQVDTWVRQIQYGSFPVLAASLLAALVLWMAVARGMKYGGWGLGSIPHLTKASVIGALVLGIFVAGATIDTWTVIRYAGGNALSGEATSWHDPIFGKPLSFYLFDLPFYRSLYSYLLTVTLLGAFLYWLAARLAGLQSGALRATDPKFALETAFLRFAGIIFLFALAARFYLKRYALLASDHGFLVGIDYVDEHIRLPFQWAMIAACLLCAAFVARGKWAAALLLPAVGGIQIAVTAGMGALYVRPNEISLERPYLEKHIQATRSAYGLDRRVKEIEFETGNDGRVDVAKHKPLIDNVRLWDRRAFHDTIQQIQALRPYYQFAGIDVDRYTIDGQLRQVLLTPRELDVAQLPDARTRWINPHFIYTHGYGLVMAEANRITADGLPHLFEIGRAHV